MGKKLMSWKTKGMNQDLSVSAFNPEFAFENVNLRLSTNEGNTLLSWVNEKGTEEAMLAASTPVQFYGTVIGTAIINHMLVVFSAGGIVSGQQRPDNIYVVKKLDTGFYTCDAIFSGYLDLNKDYPLETLVSYESEKIQKVYWTDNKNQPRVINIKDYIDHHYTAEDTEIYTKFDFVVSMDLSSTLSVTKNTTGGIFAPGVIQYCYTYINKYGQQSNVVNVSPLYYLTHTDKGASPEDKVSNSFDIVIDSPDTSFDLVRLYSIHRTSWNDVPQVLLLEDISIGNAQSLSYTDTGASGSSVDPTELLFIGGKEITALTMEEKDQTLFLGNIGYKSSDVEKIQQKYDTSRQSFEDLQTIVFHNGETEGGQTYNYKEYNLTDPTGQLYNNTFKLNDSHREITTFKGGDYYRLGFQLQKKTGEWTEPIFLGDKQNDRYPNTSIGNTKVNLVYGQYTIDLSQFNNSSSTYYIKDFYKIYKKIRPVVVYPEIQDRVTLCQGVLSPTVFNAEDRTERQPYAQSSWYFRPYTLNEPQTTNNSKIIHPTSVVETSGNIAVLMLPLKKTDVMPTLERGYLLLKQTSPLASKKIPFKGALPYDDSHYIFLIPWTAIIGELPADYEKWEDCDDKTTAAEASFSTVNDSDYYKTYALSDKVKTPFFGDSYYNDSDTDYYDFEFNVTSYDTANSSYEGGYKIRFYSIYNNGSRIAFTHYESLFTDFTDTDKPAGDIVKQAEIQGSVDKYPTPFDTAVSGVTSNTQFFVDQSIVTMNSADLEFDTNVQNYATGGLKLRIIGTIPITSSASAHHITANGPTLPLGYREEDEDGNVVEGSGVGTGELNINSYWVNKSLSAGKRLVSEYLWNDAYTSVQGDTLKATWKYATDFLVYPWQATKSLTQDTRSNTLATSVLKTKVESNILYSYNSVFFESNPVTLLEIEGRAEEYSDIKEYAFVDTTEPGELGAEYSNVNVGFHLWQNQYIENIRLLKQKASLTDDINYYPNIEKTLNNETDWSVFARGWKSTAVFNKPVLMKYSSGTHAAIALTSYGATSFAINLLPFSRYKFTPEASNTLVTKDAGKYITDYQEHTSFWNESLRFHQHGLDISSILGNTTYDTLWLGELYKDVNPNSIFGGKGRQALLANNWVVGGAAVNIPANGQCTLTWTEGDTFYQRYDCLKTYPSTPEDINQMVEILSFMCESHVNLDGRYDKNRGLTDNTNISPINFNKMNPVYDQQDNFFSYKKSDNLNDRYPNLITFTKTKTSGADVDAWTNINLASNLELDGSKGEISSIQRLNNQLFAFQHSGIAQILYNENVQIQSTEGVPIEIANSGKVQGKRYYSDTIGCSNKWSIANTPSGIYFMDSNDKGIYLFNGELNNLSTKFGFNTWCKKNIFAKRSWNPVSFEDFVTYYDKQNQDVLFINKDKCLAFSEKIGCFTSFYDYGSAPYFCNLDDEGLWIKGGSLWQHNKGDYCKFFDEQYPFSMTLVGNPEPQIDKTFTNLELRASIEGDGEYDENTGRFTPILPFNSLEVWDEYQHGYTELKNLRGVSSMMHGGNDSALKRKFRVWRCDIPRNNAVLDSNRDPEEEYPYSTDSSLKVSRYIRKPLDRMRNPWIYLKLQKNMEEEAAKTEIHDIVMTYFD